MIGGLNTNTRTVFVKEMFVRASQGRRLRSCAARPVLVLRNRALCYSFRKCVFVQHMKTPLVYQLEWPFGRVEASAEVLYCLPSASRAPALAVSQDPVTQLVTTAPAACPGELAEPIGSGHCSLSSSPLANHRTRCPYCPSALRGEGIMRPRQNIRLGENESMG